MKIFHLVENLDDSYGGPAKSITNLASYLPDSKEQELLSIRWKPNEVNEVAELKSLKWKSFRHLFFKKISYSLSLKKYLNDNNNSETIFHVHNLWNYIPYIAYKVAYKRDVKLVFSVRGSLYPWSLSQSKIIKKIAWAFFQKRALNSASCIHVTHISELKAVRNIGITTPIAVIPNGVSLKEFNYKKEKITAKKDLRLNIQKKYILFISRIHPKKGLDLLIKSWTNLNIKYPDWDLLIVGPNDDIGYLNYIKKLITDGGIKNKVHFAGMLSGEDRINSFYASSLFVLPSHTENFGIVIAEALAAGLPVITTTETPWEEIKEKNAGWWVKNKQSFIQKAMDEALSLKETELTKLTENGLNLVQSYDWQIQADKMNNLYSWVLKNTNPPDFLDFNDKEI